MTTTLSPNPDGTTAVFNYGKTTVGCSLKLHYRGGWPWQRSL